MIVGGGIVGLATARAWQALRPRDRILVLEKEREVGSHQTGRNSGVIHAGVYYRPGSEKARLCATGRASMVRFCEEREIPHEVCGKLVVATEEREIERLEELRRRCEQNGVRTRSLQGDELREVEPHVRGLRALHVLDTGIVDYRAVARVLRQTIEEAGVELRTGSEVLGAEERTGELILETTTGHVAARHVATCGGLHADRLARMISGEDAAGDMRIIPFRGEYYELRPERSELVHALIYPVPDPRFPFLGVHLTRGVDGHVHVGPNAVLALAREGYDWRTVNRADMAETLRFRGFRKLARTHWRYGLSEMARSLHRRRFGDALRRLVPEVRDEDLVPVAAGVRAQAVREDGTLVDDFAFVRRGRALHVLNAPSPAATASLEIGRTIAARLAGQTAG